MHTLAFVGQQLHMQGGRAACELTLQTRHIHTLTLPLDVVHEKHILVLMDSCTRGKADLHAGWPQRTRHIHTLTLPLYAVLPQTKLKRATRIGTGVRGQHPATTLEEYQADGRPGATLADFNCVKYQREWKQQKAAKEPVYKLVRDWLYRIFGSPGVCGSSLRIRTGPATRLVTLQSPRGRPCMLDAGAPAAKKA